MRITIDIPDEALYALLFHETPAPAEALKERDWYINDVPTWCVLLNNGFTCRLVSGHWYATNLPIEFNGSYTLPDGKVIKSHGTTLRWQIKQ